MERRVGDIIKDEKGEATLKVIKTYTVDNPELFYKDRMTLLNVDTGDTIDCANQ